MVGLILGWALSLKNEISHLPHNLSYGPINSVQPLTYLNQPHDLSAHSCHGSVFLAMNEKN